MWKKLSSDYLAAANALRGKNKRRRVVAYVESYDDILFWRTILDYAEDETRYFDIMLPNINRRLERGKKSAVAALVKNRQIGQYMIACVDADYDYLMQGSTYSSADILNNPYVLHTYAYSIENLQCYAESLRNVCVMATLNDQVHFDFAAFIHSYSLIIYPLFVWNVWYYRRGRYNEFPLLELCQMVELKKNVPLHEVLNILAQKVEKKVNALERHHPHEKMSYDALSKELQETLGIKPEDTYLYIQGHFLFEHIVTPLLHRVCRALVREREEEIRRSALHSTQARNELSCYTNSVQDVQQMLKKNTGYTRSEVFKRIVADAQRLDCAGNQALLN
ncbi:MAG: DUF4435 domain-containing protein [Bacteroidaceae bacterium]|nr:DUF4435 domain-containing protein [Bacteroidaceae bacterium]